MTASVAGRWSRPWLVALVVFLITAAAAAVMIRSLEQQRQALLRADLQAVALGIQGALEREIVHTASAALLLATLVREGGGQLDGFPRIAAELMPHYPSATCVHLSPGGVVRDLFPSSGNEPVLGLDLFANQERAAAAILARDTGRLTLGGPYPLLQGGLGIAARAPVFLPEADGQRFWGFATVVIRIADILERAGLNRLADQRQVYRLTFLPPGADASRTIATTVVAPLPEPVRVRIAAPNQTWTLELGPTDGWDDPLGLATRGAIALGFSLLLGALSFMLMRARAQRADLARSLLARTAELHAREDDLARAEAVAQVGLWEYDIRGDRLILSAVCSRLIDMPVADTDDLKGFIERVHPADRDRVAAAWAAALKGAPFDVEHRCVVAGEVRWFRQRAVLSWAEGDQVRWATGTVEDITERREAQEALRRSEARARQLIETAHEGVWLIDPEGRTLLANARLGELLGVPAAHLIGRSFLDFVDPELRPLALENLARRNQGIAEVHEFRFTRADGTPVWTLISTNPIFDQDGRVEAALGMVADISARKQAEEALERERFLLTQAERLAQIGAWEQYLGTRQMHFSPGWCTIHGVDPNAPPTRAEHFLVHPEDRDAITAQVRADIAAAGALDLRYRIVRRADGAVRWMHALGKVLRDEQGRATRLIGVVQDVTAEVAANAELRIAAIAFEAQAGLLVTDAEECILRVNRAFTAITGYSAEEVIGKTPRLLSSGRHDNEFFAALWGEIHAKGYWEGEIWNRRRNGEVFPEWLTINAVRDERGEVSHYVGTLADISAQKEAEEAFYQLAFYDPLTHLANRRLLLDRLRQALTGSARSGQFGALIFIDLDNFKSLNDTRGHQVGDLLLEEVGRRLTATVRHSDTVARLGGDEFVVLLTGLGRDPHMAAAQAEMVARKVLLALGAPYQLGGQPHDCTPSLGIATFDGQPGDGDDANEVLRRADVAMYRAKAAGRNTMRFFDDQPPAVLAAPA